MEDERTEQPQTPEPSSSQTPSSSPAETNGHDQREFESLTAWREAKKADREAFEEFAAEEKRKAEEPPLPPPAELTATEAFEHGDDLAELEKQLAVEKDPERHLELLERYNHGLHAKNERHRLNTETKVAELAIQARQAQAALQLSQNRSELLASHLTAQLQARYGAINTQEDLQRLAQENPQAAESYLADVARARMFLDAETTQQAARQQEIAQATQGWVIEQTQKLMQRMHLDHPEAIGADGKVKREIQDATRSYLSSRGFADGEFEQLCNNIPAMLDHRVQLLLLDAGQFWKAKQRSFNATKRQLPPVQRPGVSEARPSMNYEAIRELERLPSLTPRQAARLHTLRREQ